MNKDFLSLKEKALKSLEADIDRVDKNILPLLEIINASDHFFTTSSCSGRVALMEIPEIGMKKDARFLGKWHDNIDMKEIKNALNKAKEGVMWFFAQPPILHIVADELKNAQELVKIGIASGFKNSVFKSVEGKIVIELASTERFDVPLGRDGFLFCDESYLSLLCDIGNEVLVKSRKKIDKMVKALLDLNCKNFTRRR